MSLKTLCLRIPASPTLARCCPRASYPPSNVSPALALSRSFARANHSLSSSSRPSGALSASSPRPSIASLVATRASSSSPTISSSSSSLRARPYSSSSTSSSNSSDPAAPAKLDWNSFFKLRLRRRRIQLLFSVITGLAGGAAGTVVLAEGFAEPLIAQIPLDPFFTLGIMTMACAGLGWLIGPTIGNQVFYLVNHRFKSQMLQKEAEFFARIKRHRADPTNSSAGNPGLFAVPDFYGEKIQSVAGYRRWLKDQRAFNKKKSASFV
ncbi:Presequence translocated-associated motor subunit PAM17 [Trichoderma ghanense]|uniref:Presequence translocated-associated motor subunit PAM17 n=1 Tax=Trichoderma ghanense TaxID=65468 RepID=A0ABY2GWG7_9HYPO